MGKRNVIIELGSLLSAFPIQSYFEHVVRVMDLPSALSEPATHESRFGITSNMTVDLVTRQLNSMTSWIIDEDRGSRLHLTVACLVHLRLRAAWRGIDIRVSNTFVGFYPATVRVH